MSDDEKLWQQAMQDVVPLQSNNKINLKTKPVIHKKIISPKVEEKISTVFHDNDTEYPETIFFARPGLQYKVQHQLRQGKFSIEATLDLHGFTVEEARGAVAQFLTSSLQKRLRLVKIIHGKGLTRGAVLRNKVYQWLPQSADVLAFCSTIAKDGGTGAVYVLLRR